MNTYYVYMMASKRNGTLYTGITADLVRRVYEHKNKIFKGFTSKYEVTLLVWYEAVNDVNAAIRREKNIQAWKRDWKLRLIEGFNPEWKDLFQEITGCQPALA